MAIHKPQNYLLAYDIADPARLVRVHRLCKEWGLPIQYSVFLVPLTPASIGVLLADLRATIDERADDVRVYPLPERVDIAQFGRQGFPEGIQLVGDRFVGETLDGLAAGGARRRTPGRSPRMGVA
jgi:CRISPR-associated protein Cas2